MPFVETPIKDLLIFEPKVFEDERGYFFESFNAEQFKAVGIISDFVQDNQSKSSYGVLRGLHFQVPPFSQAKLVRVLQGEVLDIAVDLRENSPTFGKHFSVLLSAENKKQLYVPRGFAHGYSTLSKEAVFFYKCDNFYSKEHEGGISYDDEDLNIDWKLKTEDIILSAKDQVLPTLKKFNNPFRL